MRDGRLLANAADDELRIHAIDKLTQIIILHRVLAHDGVFYPIHDTIINQRLRVFRLQIAFKLDVEHDRFAVGLGEFADARGAAFGRGDVARGQHHHGGEIKIPQHRRLIHRGAIRGTDRRHHCGVRSGLFLQHRQRVGVLSQRNVVEHRVTAVEQRANTAGLKVAHDLGILGGAHVEILITRQGRHSDHGVGKPLGSDGGGVHVSESAAQGWLDRVGENQNHNPRGLA